TDTVDPAGVSLILPKDFSTENPGPDLSANLEIRTDQGTDNAVIPVIIQAEGDISMPSAVLSLVETDDVVRFTPSNTVLPRPTDIDGSESIEAVGLIFRGLPLGSRVSEDGGTTWIAKDGFYLFTGTLAAYRDLIIELPKDFSTTNPVSQLFAQLAAITDEGGAAIARLDVEVDFELDANISAPAKITALEDGDGSDGGGVTVDLQIKTAVTDIDGSENSAFVEITFVDLPAGSTTNIGSLTPTVRGMKWTGTRAEAEALTLKLPGDYSGVVTARMAIISPEGVDRTTQTITITGTGDVDLDVSPVIRVETDAPISLTPSARWSASISDNDGNLPLETLTEITLTLNRMPSGVQVQGVPIGTVTYNASSGGGFTFVGSSDQYDAMRLVFPKDFSTQSRSDGFAEGPLTGTFRAKSTEDSVGQSTAVSFTIRAEGDVEIDDTLPDLVPDETDSPTVISPSGLLLPEVTDFDRSESLEMLVLTVKGLNGDATIAGLKLGLPAGAVVDLTTAGSGAKTLKVTLTSASVGDVLAVYKAMSLTLPTDFSTANRNDIGPVNTSLPLTFKLDVQTDEDRNPNTDTTNDGTATATRIVDIGFEEDISLTAPRLITAQEDGGIPDVSVGVTVDLGIDIAITDNDGSETESTADPRFAASVEIRFVNMPASTIASTGSLKGTVWTGSVADARALSLDLPGDYSGAFLSLITVTTPEGSQATVQGVRVEPTRDIIIDGSIESNETDAELELLLSNFIDVTVPDPSEVLNEIDFDLNGLPKGVRAEDGIGNTVGTITDVGGGKVNLSIVWKQGDTFDPASVILVLPRDYSTTNPSDTLTATLRAVTDQGSASGNIPLIITEEGDLRINDGATDLAETDAVVRIKPSDHVLPVATDIDMSESVIRVAGVFNNLPSGTRVTTDNGNSWTALAQDSYIFNLGFAAYQRLIIEFPRDFSTESPATTVFGEIAALTDETGVGLARLDITLEAEGDLVITGDGLIQLEENDPTGNFDEDTTTSAPLDLYLTDAWIGAASDADGSEVIANIRAVLRNLPDGTRYSLDNGASFTDVPNPTRLVLNGLDVTSYADVVIRLPDDFSTVADIRGTVTFTTDEAILATETDVDDTDGVETRDFVIRVTPEADVRISGQDIEVIEDLGKTIPLGLSAQVVDIDGSETLTPPITIAFSGLSDHGPTILTDGTRLNGPTDTWQGTASQLAALGVTSFPIH
ncbi:MAG: hypothetical protein HRU31_18185, partial [Rhodobacteraceae bacterium]|nr:hypothetical protein [Paracoccaceae bacterium]